MAEPNYLKMTAQEANSTIKLTKNGTATDVSLQYSTDGSTWSTFTVGTTYTLAAIGDTIQLRATSTNAAGMGQSGNNYHQFVMTGKIAASGNIMSLYDKDFATKTIAMTNYGFNQLFNGCTSLTTPPELPATTLATSCYQTMFYGCTSLTQAPELPATTMATGCYYSMFNGCTSLTSATELPATALTNSCYGYMFGNCTSLKKAPELPATSMKQSCYSGMFNGCISLTAAPELPATALAIGCYSNMFNGCTSLKKAPELPATSMKQSCYSNMFNGCISLNSVTAAMSSTNLAKGTYTSNWLNGVAQTGIFKPTDPDFNKDIVRGVSTVPFGWTIRAPLDGFYLNEKKVNFLFINGKQVAELYLNGKKVGYEAPEPPGPDPKLTNFRITNIGNATDNPDDTWAVKVKLPSQCDMTVYHSDSGSEGALTPGETTTLTLPYGEYLEFWGNNEPGLYPVDNYTNIICPEGGSYEASGQLSSLAMQDVKEGYSFEQLFSGSKGLTKADNLVIPDGYDGTTETFSTMFYNCSNLVKGPENIPYASGMYMFYQLFKGCSSLTSVGVDWTQWPAATTGTDETKYWLDGVAAAGTFKCPAALTIPSRDENGVPSGWTIMHT